jgi:hypothetical protein
VNNDQRQRWLLLVAGLAVALLVADRLVFTPLSIHWKEQAEQIAYLQQSVTQGSMLLDREEAIRNRWQSISTNTLPHITSAAESTLLKSFESWSQKSRLSLASMKPQWNQGDTNYMTLEYRADCFGNIDALTHFLYELEKDPLAYKIDALTISAQDKEGSQLSLNLKMSGLLLNPGTP